MKLKSLLNAFCATLILASVFAFGMMTGSVIFASVATIAVGIANFAYRNDRKAQGGYAFNAPIFVEKSEKELEDMSFEDRKKYMNELIDYRVKAKQEELQPKLDEINEKLAKGAKLEDVEKEKEELEKKLNTALDELKIMGLRVASIGDRSGKSTGGVAPTIKAALEARKDELKRFKNKETMKFSIEVDANALKATQAASDIDAGTDFAQMMPGVGQIPRQKYYIKERIRTIRTNTEYIKYLDQETVVRDADNVAACGATTHNTKLTWKTRTVQQQKVRDFVDICLDMMDDYDFVEGEIRNLLNSSLQLKIDNNLLLADGIAPNPNSIDSIASTFSASAVGADYFGALAVPTIIDLLVVAGAQISAFGSENSWMADTAYLNPRDYTLLVLLKDQNDNYIQSGIVKKDIVGFVNGVLTINGTMQVFPNPNVPANEAYVFDSTRAKIVQSKTATVEFSYENNDNFETETVTAKVYERLNLWVRNVDANAFMYIDDIEAAIVSLTTT